MLLETARDLYLSEVPERRILRNQVRDQLLKQMQEGLLTNGSSINLAKLSRTLGVSVTPIREALTQLEYAQVVRAIPKSGFVIPQLQRQKAINLYKTMAQLEMMALEDIAFSAKDVLELRQSHKSILEADTLFDRLKARFNFNYILLQNCNNKVLLQMLENLKTRLLFYERKVDLNDEFHNLMINQYEGIIQAIEEDNLPTACLVVKMNRMAILDHVAKQIPK